MRRSWAIGIIVFVLGSGYGRAGARAEPATAAIRSQPQHNEALRRTLVKMWQDDQAEALRSMKAPLVSNEDHAQERMDTLKQIIAEYGWPGISLVGNDGAEGAWVVAQHADIDLAFQRQCLALVEEAYLRGEVSGMHLAYLSDRVYSAENKPQLYGTQGAPMYSAQEKAQVEARRKRLGLPTMSEMARIRAEHYNRILRQPGGGQPPIKPGRR